MLESCGSRSVYTWLPTPRNADRCPAHPESPPRNADRPRKRLHTDGMEPLLVGSKGFDPSTFCSDLGWIGLDGLDWLGLESLENQRFQTACFFVDFAHASESKRSSCLNRVWRNVVLNATNNSSANNYAASVPNQTGSVTAYSPVLLAVILKRMTAA